MPLNQQMRHADLYDPHCEQPAQTPPITSQLRFLFHTQAASLVSRYPHYHQSQLSPDHSSQSEAQIEPSCIRLGIVQRTGARASHRLVSTRCSATIFDTLRTQPTAVKISSNTDFASTASISRRGSSRVSFELTT